ncbi:MAG: hypothetical protein Q7R30_02380 [Acidobacteriota bacterium]|nr:hypothetical protein [Acidobacteriota bacterium]
MPKRSRKPSVDPNVAAFNVLERIRELDAEPKKNPAAVALGRLGGLKGGKARAAQMTKKERSVSAKKAAEARWKRA